MNENELAKKDKKYYWLKLKKGFFKRHDMQIIEAMDNGKDYVLFYLKLLVESVDHEGELRFSDTIPYDEKMLATITNTNVDVVRSAMRIFCELGMIEILDDKTIFMREIEKMTGSETYWAKKKREQREKGDSIPKISNNDNSSEKVGQIPIVSNDCPTCPSKSKSKSKSKRKNNNNIIVADATTTPKNPLTDFDFNVSKTIRQSCLDVFPNSKVPDDKELDKWAVDIERMRRLDGRSEEEIKEALKFAINDSFWKSNIRSTKKFREKFETLIVQSRSRRGGPTYTTPPGKENTMDFAERMQRLAEEAGNNGF